MDYSTRQFNDEDDKLGRKQFAKNIMNVIEHWDENKHENDSLVFSVDASWGAGKSMFMHMWKNMLLKDNEYNNKNYVVAFYNAWENDDSENSFIPLLYALKGMKGQSGKDEIEKKITTFLKSFGVALFQDAINKYVGEETSKIIGHATEGIKEVTDADTKSFFDKYDSYIKMKSDFKEALKKLIPEDGKLIIFIDELDRCRPTFAVDTLEVVKHFFDIKDIVFIFAVDLDQLSHSIATMYGVGMDSVGYLRRFFDFNINIPSWEIEKYIAAIFKGNVIETVDSPEFIDRASKICSKLNLSLRDIDKIMLNFNVFILYYQDKINNKMRSIEKHMERADMLEIYLYFLALKYKYPKIYLSIIKADFMKYDNAPKNWPILDVKFFISGTVGKLLNEKLQTGGSLRKEEDLSKKYILLNVHCNNISFAEHIEKTLEMFA